MLVFTSTDKARWLFLYLYFVCTEYFVTLFDLVDCVWNVMAHARKPDFVFRAKRTSPFKSAGASVQSTTGIWDVRISGSNAGYTVFRGSVKSTGYPLHSPVSPFTSPPVRHRVPSHFNWSLPRLANLFQILYLFNFVFFLFYIYPFFRNLVSYAFLVFIFLVALVFVSRVWIM